MLTFLRVRAGLRAVCALFCFSVPASFAETRPDIVWMRGGHTKAAYPLHYAATGDLFASAGTEVGIGSNDTSIKIWRGSDGHLLRTLIAPLPNREISFSSDARYLASQEVEFVQARLDLWNLDTGERFGTLEPPGTRVGVFSFIPGTLLVALTSRTGWIDIYDFDGNRVDELPVDATVTGIGFNVDGGLMATGETNKVVLWQRDNAGGYSPIDVFFGSATGKTLLSADGSRVAVLAENFSVNVWRVADGAQVTLHEPTYVSGLALTSDGLIVATSGYTQAVKLWDADNGSLLQELAHEPNWLPAVIFSPDDNQLVHSLYPNELRLYQRGNDGLYQFDISVTGHTGTVFSTAFSPDGTIFATGAANYDPINSSGEVRLWERATGRHLQTLGGHRQGVYGLSFASDGDRLASASWDFTAKIWSRTDSGFEELQTLRAHTDRVNHAIFSPDDSLLATASKDRSILIWQGLPDGTFQLLQRLDESVGGHTDEVEPIAISSDGRQLFSGGHDSTVKVWNGSPDGHFEIGQTLDHVEEVESLAVTSDSSRIIAGGEDGHLRIWQLGADGSYVELVTFVGHAGAVHSIAVTPDDLAFVSVGARTITFWSMADATEVITYDTETGNPATDGVESVSFSPDGSEFGYGRVDATVVVAATPAY